LDLGQVAALYIAPRKIKHKVRVRLHALQQVPGGLGECAEKWLDLRACAVPAKACLLHEMRAEVLVDVVEVGPLLWEGLAARVIELEHRLVSLRYPPAFAAEIVLQRGNVDVLVRDAHSGVTYVRQHALLLQFEEAAFAI
jgi:hypothetical protein